MPAPYLSAETNEALNALVDLLADIAAERIAREQQQQESPEHEHVRRLTKP